MTAALTITRADQRSRETQRFAVGAGTDSPQAIEEPTPKLCSPAEPILDSGHCNAGAHIGRAAVEHTSNGSAATIRRPKPTPQTSLADPFLALAADVLDDAERNRIANENRLRQLTRSEADVDGEERGFGLDLTHPDVARLAAIVEMLTKVEHQSALNLQRMMRAHPLSAWVKAQKGVGEKQGARLLAVIGDPCQFPDGSPRAVSQLWSYCGHGDPTRKRRKGMSQADLFALGNPVAKSRLWLIATACLKAQGPYADVYYARKEQTEGREHATDCVRCGPSGHPALAGSPWSLAHRHADALRITGKEILRDLWLEAHRLHKEQS